MKYIKGEILFDSGFKKGYVIIDKNNKFEIRKGYYPKKADICGYILPTFINIHTHIGDSFLINKKKKFPKDVKKLVAPPNGLKHKLLREAANNEILCGMKKSIEEMMKSGTSYFCDFRENGIDGIKIVRSALEKFNINSIILSRPILSKYDNKEMQKLLSISEGIGISAISDWVYSELIKISKHVKKKKKIFALHASEAKRENIDLILDLKPSFLIHMTKATKSDFEIIKQENIPLALCPRSNLFFGLKPNFKLIKEIGLEIMLGTDNAMLNKPNIIKELQFTQKITNNFSTEELLNMITYTPRKALNSIDYIQGLNPFEGFVVLEKKTLNPIYIHR